MFVVMAMETTSNSSVGLDISFVNKKSGLCGALLVYETEKQARDMYPNAQILEVDIVKAGEK